MRRAASFIIIAASFFIITGLVPAGSVSAQQVPLDFINGQGWFLKQPPSTPPDGRVNFGAAGGVRDRDWWGDVVYVDKALGLQVRSLTVTGYVRVGVDGADAAGKPIGTRDICGTARTNLFGDVFYRVRLTDNGRPDRQDTVAIGLATPAGSLVYFAHGSLGDPTPGNGKISISGPNRSSIAPLTPPDCRISFDAAPPDTTPPTVAIASPTSGATVSGTITVTASASDNVAVAGVRFFVDGVAIGAEDTAAPFAVSWDTTTVPDGAHTVQAVARDAAGNTATSTPVTVTVANAAPKPTVTRFEENSATFTGIWVSRGAEIASFSGGTAVSSDITGATATLTFTGTGVSWIGLKCNVCGIASVSIDSGPATLVDTAGTAAPGSPGLTSEAVFTASGLGAGSHTIVITVTGSTSSGATNIVVDAFDVTN